MSIPKRENSSENFDVIKKLYEDGFYDVIEKICLNLTKKSMRALKETDPTWKNIVTKFIDSGRPGVKKLIDERIRRNIRNHKATIMSSKFTSTRNSLGCIMPLEIVADERNVFVGGNETDDVEIHVLNAETFNRIAILRIGQNVHTRDYIIKHLDLNENFLVALIEIRDFNDPFHGCFTAKVWRRDPMLIQTFYPHPVQIPVTKIWTSICTGSVLPFPIETHFCENVLTHIEERVTKESFLTSSFRRWNLEKNEREGTITMVTCVDQTHPNVKIIPLSVETNGDFLSWNTNPTEGVLKRHRHSKGEIIWAKAFNPVNDIKKNCRICLLGVFEAYAVVCYSNEAFEGALLELVDLVSGVTANNLELNNEVTKITRVQVCHGRIAVQGWGFAPIANGAPKSILDIIVAEIKSGEILLRLKDLGFLHCQGNFCLEKDRITFYNCFQYHSARFWI